MSDKPILAATTDAAHSTSKLKARHKRFLGNPTKQDIENLSAVFDQVHDNLVKLRTTLKLKKS